MADADENRKPTTRKRRDTTKTTDELGRQLPHNLDAEEGVIAAILIDGANEVITQCVSLKVRAEYFFKPQHRIIYEALLALYSEGANIDEIVLAEYLKKRNALEQVGGVVAINNIAGRIETYTHYRQWIEILREKYFMREIIRACSETIENAYANRGGIDTFIEGVEEKILGISQDRVGDSVKKASEQVEGAVALINKLIASKGELMGVPTGFTGLDNMMRGLHANEMIVIAGRPGTGKTSIALNIVESAIFKEDPAPALVFSLEMLADQLYMRMIASRARVDQYKLGMGRLDKGKMEDIQTTAREIANAPLWIDDSESLTILEMRARARRLNQDLVRKGKHLGLIVVDYLQLLKPTDASTPREQAVGEISRGMKAMAKELKVPVIVLAQLNRDSEKDQRTPRASDLRESGSIEQDADVIILLSRQKTTDEAAERDCWPIRVDVVKQRNGPTGPSTLLFNRSYTRYENYEKDETI